MGKVWRDEPETHPARDKAGLFLFWVVAGGGEFHSGRECWRLGRSPCCWLADMALRRTYIPTPGKRLVTAGLRFSGPGLDAWRDVLRPGEVRFSSMKAMGMISRTHARLNRLITRRPAGYEWAVHEVMTQMIGRLLEARKAWPKSDDDVPKPVSRVIDAVLKDASRGWRAAELAEIASVSYSGLRAMFRKAQQETLSDFLQRTRLDQSRLLLADDRLPVKEVARRLEFSSEFYFSQWFRRHTKTSPTAFRQMLRR